MKLTVSLSLLFIFLQVKVWYGADNIFELQALDNFISQQTIINDQLFKRNQQLENTIDQLKSEDSNIQNAYIEDYARWKLNMVKTDEIFYYW